MTTPQPKRKGLLLPIALLIAGIATAVTLMLTAPETTPEEKTSATKIVQVIEVEPHTAKISVAAFGTVIPAREIEIQPEVGGRVISHHEALVPGGRIAAGEVIVTIDPADYDLALAERRANLKEAEFELAVEKGRQVVAQREWGLLERDLEESEVNRSLVLREPHLARAEATVAKANNAISKAELDLSRTQLSAPFNAMVLDESVEVGQLIEPGKTIATLVGTDTFWIQVSLPVEDLRWIRIPGGEVATGEGAAASVTLDTGESETVFTWDGSVERLLGDLETSGRMARVLVSVSDPLAGAAGATGLPLLLGSYVRVDIDAGELDEVIAVPRTALRDGERLWTVDAADKLRIHETELRWATGETLLVSNTIPPGQRLIVSGLRAALPGMDVDPQPAPGSQSPDR